MLCGDISDKYTSINKKLEECLQNHIDLHLSVHTHDGQIFPLYF